MLNYIYFLAVRQLPVGQDLFNMHATRAQPDKPQWVGFLWISDQSDTETWT